MPSAERAGAKVTQAGVNALKTHTITAARMCLYAVFCSQLLVGCGPGPANWRQPRAGTTVREAKTEGSFERPAHWVLLPEFVSGAEESSAHQLLVDNVRLESWPDGTLRRGRELLPVEDVHALKLPPRLGTGYLFYGESEGSTLMWRTDSWTGALRPLARVSEGLSGIFPGFDRLYLRLAMSHRVVGLDLKSGRLLPARPLPPAASYESIAIADAWFGAVVTEVRGVLVTFDAGFSWSQLELDDPQPNVRLVDGQIIVHSDGKEWLLSRDGKLEPFLPDGGESLFADYNAQVLGEGDLDEEPPLVRPVSKPLGRRPLRHAVLYGWPLGDGTALTTNRGALGRVRLEDGKLLEWTPDAYPGNLPCTPVALEAGVGFVCSERDKGTQIYRWNPPLDLTLVNTFTTPRAVSPNGKGALAIRGGCSDPVIRLKNSAPAGSEGSSQRYCIRHVTGQLEEIRVRGDTGVERVIPLNSGVVLVLIPPRLGSPGMLNLIQDGATTKRKLQLPAKRAVRDFLMRGFWLNSSRQTGLDSVSTWVVSADGLAGIEIKSTGAVTGQLVKNTSPERTLFHGAIALELSDAEFARETTDYGKTWHKLDTPPGMPLLDPKSSPTSAGATPVAGCSRVGCAYGAWLRVGYNKPAEDEQASKPEGASDTEHPPRPGDDLAQAPIPPLLNLNPAASPEWAFTCDSTGSARTVQDNQRRGLLWSPRTHRRRGFQLGFSGPALGAAPPPPPGPPSAVASLEGVPPPRLPSDMLQFAVGSAHPPAFQAFAWGYPGPQWSSTGSWQLRVASPWAIDGLWASAVTASPWSDAGLAAAAFGEAEQSDTTQEWTLTLDPAAHRGLLRVGSRSQTELHIVEEGLPIRSYGSQSLGKLAGAVKVSGKWYFGQREGGLLSILRADSDGLHPVNVVNVGPTSLAVLVSDSTESRLGILVRASIGAWFLYPLDERMRGQEPLGFSREELNASPRLCSSEEVGWHITATLPLTRLSGSDSTRFLSFNGAAESWKARRVAAQLIANPDAICVSELAAELQVAAGSITPPPKASEFTPVVGVPLTLRSGASPATRVRFRCHTEGP